MTPEERIAQLEAENKELRDFVWGGQIEDKWSWGIWDGDKHHLFCNFPVKPLGERHCNCPVGKKMWQLRKERDNYKRFIDALDDMLVCQFDVLNLDAEDPRTEIAKISQFDVMVALDPAVSKEARDLIERGRREERDEWLAVAAGKIPEKK